MKFVFLLLVVIFCGCSTHTDKGSSETKTSIPVKNMIPVIESDYDGKWPFLLSEGAIKCENGNYVLFIANGRKYAINGSARTAMDRMEFLRKKIG